MLSYAGVVKNEKPYEKQPFWMSGKKEHPPGLKSIDVYKLYCVTIIKVHGSNHVLDQLTNLIIAVLKNSWETEENIVPASKTMKNAQKPEKMQEDNNNSSKISPQDWPPSLK